MTDFADGTAPSAVRNFTEVFLSVTVIKAVTGGDAIKEAPVFASTSAFARKRCG